MVIAVSAFLLNKDNPTRFKGADAEPAK